jgi:hypothetical protein
VVPEEVVERAAIDRQRWAKWTSIVVIVSGCNFVLGRYANRTVVDADLSPA